MKEPNFFIVGAPKCGTTALYEYLRTHPNIFLPDLKSPHFFGDDLSALCGHRSLEEYLQIFAGAGERHLAVGEASVFYLYSQSAMGRILEFAPGAKLIAMIRNPVEMVPALHNELLFELCEDERDLEAAWRLQDERAAGSRIPPRCPTPQMLQYRQVAALGSQLERALEIVPRERLLIILQDEMARDTPRVYEEVLRFLEVPSDGRTSFDRRNQRKTARFGWLQNALYLYRVPLPLRVLGRRFGLHHIHRRLIEMNSVGRKRPSLSEAFRSELIEVFRGEIHKLETLLDRDLSYWLQEPSAKVARG